MVCRNCGARLEEDALFCPECGTVVRKSEPAVQDDNTSVFEQPQGIEHTSENNQAGDLPVQPANDAGEDMYCPSCGNKLFENEIFCGQCGARVDGTAVGASASPPANAKKKLPAWVIVLIVIGGMWASFVLLICAVGAYYTFFADTTVEPQDEPTDIVAVTEDEPVPTQIPTPVFPYISASSTRGADYTSGGRIEYPVSNAVDGDYSTCWACDRNYELTPTITLSADTSQYVKGIRISNGYFKSEETYTRNRRITRVQVSYNGGSRTVDIPIESYRIMKDIAFDAPAYTDYITVRVLDTYLGNGDWYDVCISEIEVY